MRAFFLIHLAAATYVCGANYHVDCAAGNDQNPGTSQEAAWRSLERANKVQLKAGDRLLLKAGCQWHGQLAPAGSGSAASPVVIDRYGSGARPRIDGDGRVEDAVRLYNVEHIEIRNLEVTNLGTDTAMRRGVHLFLDNFGAAKHIVVADLYVHDVNGDNKHKDSGGIIFRTNGDKVPSRFDGLTIERNIVWKVDRSGIAAQSYHWRRNHWFPSLHVVIRDNLVEDIGGDGIVPWATDGVLVEHNIARDCNRRARSYNAGIWPWSADNSVFQLNEASSTRSTLDGQGFDSDYNSRNTLFQYNYSHDNEGGFMLICSPGKRDPKENLGNIGTVVRHNVSRNDRARIFHLSSAERTLVHDNVIFVGPSLDVQMLVATDWEGWADGATFRNNSFLVKGKAAYGHEVKRRDDGTYEMAPGWGPAKDIVFQGNLYAGRNENRPEDPQAKVVTTVSEPDLDWTGPSFSAAKPEGFGAFLAEHRKWLTGLLEKVLERPVRLN